MTNDHRLRIRSRVILAIESLGLILDDLTADDLSSYGPMGFTKPSSGDSFLVNALTDARLMLSISAIGYGSEEQDCPTTGNGLPLTGK